MENGKMSGNNDATFMTWGQAKQAMRVIAILCVAVVIVLMLPNLLDAFKGEGSFVGSWSREGYSGAYYTFYSDGTCEVRGEYGTCQWSLVDGKLKIINYYGQTDAYDYEWQGFNLVINGVTFTKIQD